MFVCIGAYLIVANIVAFAVFASDKRRATGGARRVPERTLLQLAILGGTLGALLAQRLLRHKTRKEPFRSHLILIAFLQSALCVGAAIWAKGCGAPF